MDNTELFDGLKEIDKLFKTLKKLEVGLFEQQEELQNLKDRLNLLGRAVIEAVEKGVL